MDLRPYVENIQVELIVAADAGGEEARALADRLLPTLDAAIRLTLQDVLVAAVEEITTELAPGSVELRLRGRETEFVVTPPPADAPESAGFAAAEPAPPARDPDPPEADDGSVARINLRMPDQLKGRIERAAAGENLSVNTWLVRAATAVLERGAARPTGESHPSWGGQHYTGWAR